jgi:hypothetical protein
MLENTKVDRRLLAKRARAEVNAQQPLAGGVR